MLQLDPDISVKLEPYHEGVLENHVATLRYQAKGFKNSELIKNVIGLLDIAAFCGHGDDAHWDLFFRCYIWSKFTDAPGLSST